MDERYYRVNQDGHDEVYYGNGDPTTDEKVGEITHPITDPSQQLSEMILDHANFSNPQREALKTILLGTDRTD